MRRKEDHQRLRRESWSSYNVHARGTHVSRVWQRSFIAVSLSLILAACSKPEPEVVEEPPPVEVEVAPLYSYTDSIVFNNKSIKAVTPVTHMEIVGEELRIFPYFDYGEYILMKVIVNSGNNLYEKILRSNDNNPNFILEKDRKWFYQSNAGTTIGILPIDMETSYYIETSKFPSSYVELVLDELIKQQTNMEDSQ